MYELIKQYLVTIIIAIVSSILIVGACYIWLIRRHLEMRFDELNVWLRRIMKDRADDSRGIASRTVASPADSKSIERQLETLAMHLDKHLHSTEQRLSMLLSEMSRLEATQIPASVGSPIALEKSISSGERVLASKYDVFLSYSSKDEEEANKIYEAITSAGGKIFLSLKSLRPGEDFSEKIRMALSESRELWLLVSPNSLKSDWVVSEWGAAWALGKNIVPILHRCDLEHLPERINRLQCIDFYKYPDLVKSTFKR